jgi:hypothetical protein
MYTIGEMASDAVANYATSGNISLLQEASTQCEQAGKCSNLEIVRCALVNGYCLGSATLVMPSRYPRFSAIMKPSHTPDWCAPFLACTSGCVLILTQAGLTLQRNE